MTTKIANAFLCCLVFLGYIIYSAQAQDPGFGSVSYNPTFRKLTVCNYNGVCHPLHLNKQLDQTFLQKRDNWKRILRSPGFDNGPPQLTSLGDPTRKLDNNLMEILKNEEPKMENDSWPKLKKEGLWSKLVRYPVDIGDRFRHVRGKM
jgi:hypothetical protein